MNGSRGLPVLGLPLHGQAGKLKNPAASYGVSAHFFGSDPVGDTIEMITHCIMDPYYFNMPFSFQNFSAPG